MNSSLRAPKIRQLNRSVSQSAGFEDIVQDLKSLLNALPGQCAVLNKDGRIQLVNQEWDDFADQNGARPNSYSKSFAIGSNYITVCDSASGSCSTGASAVSQGIRSILAGTQTSFDFEYPCHSPNEKRWFKCLARMFPADSRFAELCLIQHINVTDQVKRREAAIDQSNRLASFAEQIGAGLWTYNTLRQSFTLDSRHDPILGLSSQKEVPFTEFVKLLHKDDVQPLNQALNAAFSASSQSSECDIRVVDIHNEQKNYSLFISTDQAAESAPGMLQVFYIDRTESLSDTFSKQKFDFELRHLIDHMPIRFSKLDKTLSYVFINKEFTEKTGIPLENAIGSHVSSVIGRDGWSQVRRALVNALEGATEILDLDFHLPNGERFEGVGVYVPSTNFRGDIDGVYCIIQDLGVLKDREREAIFARREAENANQAKSEFFAALSHDFRTPLNAILGFSEVIDMEIFGAIENPVYKDYIKDILKSANTLMGMINTAIDFSKIESGNYTLHFEAFDINEVLRDCLSIIKMINTNSAIELDFETAVPGDFYSDKTALKQIVLNLLSNSAKFTEAGRISLTATEKDGSLSIVVEDTGIGMTPEILSKCREPFTTTAKTATSDTGGWGLGLSIVDALVKAHDGQLIIDSEEDKGTRVEIILPYETSAP